MIRNDYPLSDRLCHRPYPAPATARLRLAAIIRNDCPFSGCSIPVRPQRLSFSCARAFALARAAGAARSFARRGRCHDFPLSRQPDIPTGKTGAERNGSAGSAL